MREDDMGAEWSEGQTVQALREAKLLSQVDLADRMRQRGFKWAQNTVSAVESGQRPLRLAEAAAIADVAHMGLGEAFGSPWKDGGSSEILDIFARWSTSVLEAGAEAAAAIKRTVSARPGNSAAERIEIWARGERVWAGDFVGPGCVRTADGITVVEYDETIMRWDTRFIRPSRSLAEAES